jgi:RIO kinase 1
LTGNNHAPKIMQRDVAKRASFGRYAPELLATDYGGDLGWRGGRLQPDSPLTRASAG